MAHALAEVRILPTLQCSEAVALARELGMELQAKRYEKPLAENAFTPLTADEVTLWDHHCPTCYRPGGGERIRDLKDYAFDSVPIEVMRHWKAIKDNYTFDRYEVWTTERRPRAADPLLIGVIGQKLYLLARWGMESPGSLSVKDIAQSVYDKNYNELAEYGGAYDYPFQSRAKALVSRLRSRLKYSDSFAAAARYLGRA